MKRKIKYRLPLFWLLILCGLLAFPVNGSAQTVTPTFVGTTGNYSTAAFGSISSSVGEPMVTTYTVGVGVVRALTQGFQQPEALEVEIDTIVATPNDTICLGNSTTLTAVVINGFPPYTYAWTPAAGLSSTTVSNPVASPTTTTTYTLVVTDNNLPTPKDDTAFITITVIQPVVTVSVTPNDSICPGGSVTLTASASGGIGPYTYMWMPGSVAGNPFTASPTTTTTYTVIANDKIGCNGFATQTITVNPVPTLTVSASPNPVCTGQTLSLTAASTGGATYSWGGPNSFTSTLQNPTIAGITAAGAGTYSATTTSSAGCTSLQALVSVTVNSTPTVTASAPVSICNGQATTFTVSVSGGTTPYTYAWNPGGNTTSSITVAPTANTSYTVTVTTSTGCVSTGTTSATVNPLPAAATGPNKTICPGGSTTIGGSGIGGNTYAWSPSAGLSNATSPNPTASPTTSTIYTLTETITATGCAKTNTVSVSVAASPTVTISGTTTICNGSSTTLTASASGSSPYTYAWAPGAGTTSAIAVSPTSTTGYTVTVTDATTCTAQATATVTVNPIPSLTVTASPSFTICNGSNTTLTASGASSYAWSPATGLSNPSISNPIANPTTTINYTVSGTSSGCTGTTTVSVNVSQPPTAANAGPDQSLCGVTTTSLSGNTPATGTGLWSVVSGTATVTTTTSPTSGVTGLVIGSSATLRWTISNAPCTPSFDDVIITVNPTPTVSISPASATICNGSSTTLTASGASSYAWSPATGLSNPAISNPVANPTATITYTVTGTTSGCPGTKTVTVTVNPVPTLTISASPSATICSGSSTTLSASGSPGGNVYVWNPGGTTAASITAAPTTGTNYTITATNTGCSSQTTFSVTVNPSPGAPSMSSNTTLCSGATLSLTASSTGATSYSWTGPNSFSSTLQNPTISSIGTAATGTYTVIPSISATGCTGPAGTTAVVVNQTPAAPAAGSNSPVCSGQTLSLTASTTGSTYAWNGPNSFTSTAQNPTITLAGTAASGTYSVTATNSGCTGPAGTVSVTVNATPAAPSPSVTPSSACTGQSISLSSNNVTGASSYAWTGPNGFTSASQNPVIASSTTAHSGTYSVTASSAAGCTGPAGMVAVTVNQTAAPSASAAVNPVCAGQTLSLSAGGSGFTYSWTGPNSFTSTQQNPTIPGVSTAAGGTYSVVATNTITTCSSPAGVVTVTVNPLPAAPTASATPNPVCSGTTLSLAASAGGSSYAWSGPNSFVSAVQNPTIAAVSTLASGTYSVTLTNASGCTSPAGTVSVTVNAAPSSPAPLGSNSPVCEGSALSLTSATITGAVYSWSGPNSFTSSLEDPSIASATTAASGTYSVFATVSGCAGPAATVSVSVDAAPSANAGADQTVCGSTATLNGNTPAFGTGAWSVLAGTGTVTATSNPNSGVTGMSAGTNLFVWTITNGVCPPSTATVSITVNTPPTLSAASSNALCAGSCNGSVTANPVGGTSPYTYNWSDWQTTQTASNLCAGNYSVLVTDALGCTASATSTITAPPALGATINSTNVLCNGGTTGSATVTPSGGTAPYTYSWSNGQSTSTATGLGQASYTLTLSDANNCSSSFTVSITEPAALVLSPAGTLTTSCSTSCDGSVNSGPSGGTSPYTYNWSDGQTTQTATGLCAASYTITVLDMNGCSTASVVTVSPGPVLSASATATQTLVCAGSSVTLTASGGTNYSWNTGATTSSTIVNPTASTVYTVTVSSGTCSQNATIAVNVNPAPSVVVNATSNNPCAGTNDTLTAVVSSGTSPFTYAWSTGETTSLIIVAPTATTTYTIDITDANGCTANTSWTLAPSSLPTASISGGGTICSGTSAVLTANGGTNYSWNTGALTSSITVNPSAQTGYTVVVTNASGCSAVASATVDVTSAPNALITVTPNTTTICSGTTLTLTATGGSSYTWLNNSATSPSIAITPTVTTTYTLVAYNGSCTDSAYQTINVSAVSVSIGGNSSLCVGGSTTLIASVTGGTAPLTYAWLPGGQSLPSIIDTYTAAGTYNYTVTVTDGTGCSGTNTYAVNVSAPPVPTLTAPATICLFTTATLTAGGGSSYSWSTGAQTNTITVTPITTGSTSYTVTVFNGTCSADTSVTISVLPLPVITGTSSAAVICPGDMVTLNATGGIAYSWLGLGLVNPVTVTPSATSNYTVVGLGTNGCYNFDTVGISMSIITVNASTDKSTICPGFTAHLLATVSGDTTGLWYDWFPYEPTLNDTTVPNPSANPDSTSLYFVQVGNAAGCWAKDSILITISRDASCVLVIYNGITPNGDGDNDIWWIDGIQSFPDNKVDIFNRWGNKVWHGEGYDNKNVVWKGTNQQGEALPDGTYYYIVELYDTDGSVLFSASKWVEVTH